MQTIDARSYEKLAAAPGLVLMEFTAAWCAPCRTLAPVLDALADEYAGKVRVVAIDTERDQLLAQHFNVRAMPTCVVVRDGREVGRIVGARPRAFIAGVLDRAIAGDVAIAGP